MSTQTSTRGDVRSSAFMAAGTLLSRILGFVKTFLLLAALGADATVTDTFVNANNLPNLIFLLVAGGVFNAVLVPQIIKASKAPDRGADYVSRLLTLAVLVLLVLTVLVTAGAPFILRLTTQGYSDAQLSLAVAFGFLVLPQIFFYGLYALLTQVLNANGSFVAAMWAPIVNNLVAIGGLVAFLVTMGSYVQNPHTIESWTSAQTLLVAGTATLGVVVQTLLLFVPVKRLGLGLRPRFGWRGVGLGRAAKLGIWTLLTAVVGQGTFLYMMKVASIPGAERQRLDEAGHHDAALGIAGQGVLDAATQLYILPHSIIALSLATVLFNRMSHASQAGDRDALRQTLSQGLRTMAVATVFGAVSLLVLAGPLGKLFTNGATTGAALVGQTLAILALSTPFMSANFMMARVFYSNEDARTPFKIQLWLAGFNIVGAFAASLLPVHSIVFGIAALYAAGNILSVVISVIYLRRLLGHLDGAVVSTAHLRIGFAATAAALGGMVTLWVFGGYRADGLLWTTRGGVEGNILVLLVIAVTAVVMLLIYAMLLKSLKVHEYQQLAAPLLARFGRGSVAAGGSTTGPAAGSTAGAAPGATETMAAATEQPPAGPDVDGSANGSSSRVPVEAAARSSVSRWTAPGGRRSLFRPRPPVPGRRTNQGRPQDRGER